MHHAMIWFVRPLFAFKVLMLLAKMHCVMEFLHMSSMGYLGFIVRLSPFWIQESVNKRKLQEKKRA